MWLCYANNASRVMWVMNAIYITMACARCRNCHRAIRHMLLHREPRSLCAEKFTNSSPESTPSEIGFRPGSRAGGGWHSRPAPLRSKSEATTSHGPRRLLPAIYDANLDGFRAKWRILYRAKWPRCAEQRYSRQEVQPSTVKRILKVKTHG